MVIIHHRSGEETNNKNKADFPFVLKFQPLKPGQQILNVCGKKNTNNTLAKEVAVIPIFSKVDLNLCVNKNNELVRLKFN